MSLAYITTGVYHISQLKIRNKFHFLRAKGEYCFSGLDSLSMRFSSESCKALTILIESLRRIRWFGSFWSLIVGQKTSDLRCLLLLIPTLARLIDGKRAAKWIAIAKLITKFSTPVSARVKRSLKKRLLCRYCRPSTIINDPGQLTTLQFIDPWPILERGFYRSVFCSRAQRCSGN